MLIHLLVRRIPRHIVDTVPRTSQPH